MALDLAHAHAARIQANDVIVKTGQPALIFTHPLWLEPGLPSTGDSQLQFAAGHDHRLGAALVAMIAILTLLDFAFQMVRQFFGQPHWMSR
jgi:hypothetical protein